MQALVQVAMDGPDLPAQPVDLFRIEGLGSVAQGLFGLMVPFSVATDMTESIGS